MKKEKPKMVWYCVPCKEHKPRLPGQKKVRCETCNRRMKKRKLAKDGTVVTVRGGIMREQQPETAESLQGKTAKMKYDTFALSYVDMASAQRRGYLRRLWKGLFPKEEYPAKQTNWMVHLRVQYELAAHVLEERDVAPSVRFAKNYEASKAFSVQEFSEGLRSLSEVYNAIEERDEAEASS